MKTYTITIQAPQGADLNLAKHAAQMAVNPDFLLSVWHIDDVREESDQDLTDDQCREVLRRVDRGHDCNVGINWDVIRYHADMVAEESEANSENEVTL